jgi:hypothetical protein
MTPQRHDACPPTELLVDAASPGSDRAARERVADHLLTCARCADEFRVLLTLGPWAADHAPLLAGAAPTTTTTGAAIRSRSWRATVGYAAAAVLAIATVGLTMQVRRLERANETLASRAVAPPAETSRLEARLAEQQRTIGDLQQQLQSAIVPDLNAPIVDLEPADASRSATVAPAPPAIPPNTRHVVFVLNTTRPAAGATYEVEMIDSAGRVVWVGDGLRQTADRTLTLVVPRSLVDRTARIRLYGSQYDKRVLVEQYAVQITRR